VDGDTVRRLLAPGMLRPGGVDTPVDPVKKWHADNEQALYKAGDWTCALGAHTLLWTE